jgi:predicted membrane protein
MEPLANSSEDRASSESRPSARCSDSWFGGRVVFGLVLFLFGGLLLLDRFGWIDADRWFYLWALFPMAIGATKLIQPRREGDRFVGAMLIFIFGAILLRNMGWLDFRIDGRLILPGVLLLIGIRLMTTPRRSWGRRDRYAQGLGVNSSSGDEINTFAMLGSSRVTNTSATFHGGQASAVLGACEIDLRSASIPAGSEAVLDVFAMWGGIDILVPENWTVVVAGTPILASFDDQRQPPLAPTGRLVVKGFAVMGGVEIKNQRKRDF